jgi:transcriptional regulator with XRE-family HTH domain
VPETLAGKSQTEVAESLGLTFQQVQKYEKGTNRISAGKLHELSRLFDTPVQFFFDGMAGAVSMKIVTAFEKADSSLRRMLAQHVEDVARLLPATTLRRPRFGLLRNETGERRLSDFNWPLQYPKLVY